MTARRGIAARVYPVVQSKTGGVWCPLVEICNGVSDRLRSKYGLAYIRKVTGRLRSDSLAKVKSSLLSLSMALMSTVGRVLRQVESKLTASLAGRQGPVLN